MTRVTATEEALRWVARLTEAHGPVVFFQSGGCCDGSAPMCWPRGEFKLGARDVLLGTVGGAEVWIGGDQFEVWKHTRLTLDVVPGRGAGFSLEAPEGIRFLIRSDVCTVDEQLALDPQREPEDHPSNPGAMAARMKR